MLVISTCPPFGGVKTTQPERAISATAIPNGSACIPCSPYRLAAEELEEVGARQVLVKRHPRSGAAYTIPKPGHVLARVRVGEADDVEGQVSAEAPRAGDDLDRLLDPFGGVEAADADDRVPSLVPRPG